MRAHPDSSIVGAAAVVASFALAPDAGRCRAGHHHGRRASGFRLDPLVLESPRDRRRHRLGEVRGVPRPRAAASTCRSSASSARARTASARSTIRAAQHRPRRRPLRARLRRRGQLRLALDYNKIPHHFGNDGRLIWNRTGSGRSRSPTPSSRRCRAASSSSSRSTAAASTSPSSTACSRPYLATADQVDLGLQPRPHLRARRPGQDAARSAGLSSTAREPRRHPPVRRQLRLQQRHRAPRADRLRHHRRERSAASGAPSAAACASATGTPASRTTSRTLIWDNPFRVTDSTDGNAYQSPGSSSIGGSSLGFADLAPDNDVGLSLRSTAASRFGGDWWASGSVDLHDDGAGRPAAALHRSTPRIVGIDLEPAPPSTRPTRRTCRPRSADTEVEGAERRRQRRQRASATT